MLQLISRCCTALQWKVLCDSAPWRLGVFVSVCVRSFWECVYLCVCLCVLSVCIFMCTFVCAPAYVLSEWVSVCQWVCNVCRCVLSVCGECMRLCVFMCLGDSHALPIIMRAVRQSCAFNHHSSRKLSKTFSMHACMYHVCVCARVCADASAWMASRCEVPQCVACRELML